MVGEFGGLWGTGKTGLCSVLLDSVITWGHCSEVYIPTRGDTRNCVVYCTTLTALGVAVGPWGCFGPHFDDIVFA